MIFAQLAISIAISIIFAPDGPEDAEASTLEDFDIPTLNQGQTVPVIFGTFLMKNASVVWYGDLATEEVSTSAGK